MHIKNWSYQEFKVFSFAFIGFGFLPRDKNYIIKKYEYSIKFEIMIQ